MLRNMDLIRELLLRLEGLPSTPSSVYILTPAMEEIAIAGYSADQIHYHLSLIIEAGLIESGSTPVVQCGFMFMRLSWAGHDFLDSIRDPEVWARTKKGAEAAGGFTFDLLKDLAKGFIRKQVEDYTGIKL